MSGETLVREGGRKKGEHKGKPELALRTGDNRRWVSEERPPKQQRGKGEGISCPQ